MSLIRDFIDKIRRKRAAPVITSEYGQTSESARRQAALNMRDDADLRYRVVSALAQKFDGDWRKALTEAERRYPEAEWGNISERLNRK